MSEYSVALWSTPMPWPLSYAVHLWFVVSKDGVSDRFEVWAELGKFTGSLVKKNATGLESGFRSSYFDDAVSPRKIGRATLLGRITGTEGSDVAKLYTRIVTSIQTYPYNKRYRMWPGPNSNTYVAWCLDPFPALPLVLPFTAFGKKYKLPL